VKNLAPFWTTSDFDREYGDIGHGWRYPKSERHAIDKQFLSRSAKKSLVNFGPLTTLFKLGAN